MKLTDLARDIITHLRNTGSMPEQLTEQQQETLVSDVLDAVETLGGFDLTDYESVDGLPAYEDFDDYVDDYDDD